MKTLSSVILVALLSVPAVGQITLPVDTAVSVPIHIAPIVDSDGAILDSLTYDQAGLSLKWVFVTAAGATTETAVTPTNTGGDYDWVDNGITYEIEIPASGGASINNDTEGYGYFVGDCTASLPWRGPVIAFVPANVANSLVAGSDLLDTSMVQLGGNATGVTNMTEMYITDWATGYDATANMLNVDVENVEGTAPSSGGLLSAADVSAAVWNAATGSYGGAGTYGQAAEDILDDTGTSGVQIPAGEIVSATFGTGAIDATAIATNAIVNGTEASGFGTAQTGDSYAIVNSGTYGNAALKTLIDAVDDYVDTEVAAILADTNEMQGDLANGGRLDLIFDATLKADVGYGVTTTNGAITATFDSTP